MSVASRPRIVLHVGAPKTASTYIQRRLRVNEEQLRKHGIYLPVLPEVAAMAGNAGQQSRIRLHSLEVYVTTSSRAQLR